MPVPRIGNILYLPVDEIFLPLNIDIETIPIIKGISFKPASVAELPFTTCNCGSVFGLPQLRQPLPHQITFGARRKSR